MATSECLFWSCKWDSGWSWGPDSCFLRCCLGLVVDLKTLANFCSSWITSLVPSARSLREDPWERRGLLERQLASYRLRVAPEKGFFLMRSFAPESPEWNPSAKLYSKSLGHPSCVAEATVVRHLMTERKRRTHKRLPWLQLKLWLECQRQTP